MMMIRSLNCWQANAIALVMNPAVFTSGLNLSKTNLTSRETYVRMDRHSYKLSPMPQQRWLPMSEWIETHKPCPISGCSSTDGYSVNSEGWGTCFSCGGKTPPNDKPKAISMTTKKLDLLPTGVYKSLAKRNLDDMVCKKFGYSVGEDAKGNTVQIAAYRDAMGHTVAQKLRYAGKDFRSTGDMKKAQMFGQHLWKMGGKRLVITEGEIDCLAYATVTNSSWPVVSVKSLSRFSL